MSRLSEFVSSHSNALRQFVRYFIVGLSNAAICYILFCIFYDARPEQPGQGALAQAGAHAVVLVWGYFWNRRWSFQSTNSVGNEGARYLVVQTFLFFLGVGLVGLAVDILSLPPTPSWIAMNGIIIIVNFSLLKFWVFRSNPAPALVSADGINET